MALPWLFENLPHNQSHLSESMPAEVEASVIKCLNLSEICQSTAAPQGSNTPLRAPIQWKQIALAEGISEQQFEETKSSLAGDEGRTYFQLQMIQIKSLMTLLKQQGTVNLSPVKGRELIDEINKKNEELLNPKTFSWKRLTELVQLISTKVESIELKDAGLTAAPPGLHLLTGLKRLSMHGNHLKTIPEYVFKPLKNVTHINLSHNQLTDLPQSMGQLPKLKEVDVSSNKLTTLPDFEEKAETLDKPRLLSPSMATSHKIVQLKLNISDNELTALPGTLLDARRIDVIASGNHFDEATDERLEEKHRHILAQRQSSLPSPEGNSDSCCVVQ